jgi:hypothetical protein
VRGGVPDGGRSGEGFCSTGRRGWDRLELDAFYAG